MSETKLKHLLQTLWAANTSVRGLEIEDEIIKTFTSLESSRDAWKKLAEELEHPKHAYRYYCMWCGNLLVNIGHSPDCPIEQLRKMKEGEG